MTGKKETGTNSLLISLVLVILTTGPARGAETEDQQKIDEIVVTASRTEKRSIDVPITTQVITRDKILMSGVTELGDLIGKYVTGHYHKYNGMLSPVGLRGFRTDAHGDDLAGHVLLLIDGHRIGTGNAAKINLDRIERVEIIKGPASALYGSAAMGGVINLITKKGDDDLGGAISAEYGSFDGYRGLLSGGGEVNDTFRFFAAASIDHIGNYDDPSYGTAYNSGVEKKNIGGNFLYSPSGNHEFRLGGNYADLTSESPSWAEGTYTTYDEDNRHNNDKSTAYADLEYNGEYFGGKMHWKGLGYYLWDKNHAKWGEPDPDASQTKYIDTTLGTDHQISWKMSPENTLLAGFTLDSLEKKSSGRSNYQPSAPYTPGLEYDNQALFLQDSFDFLNNRVNIVAAARYDRFDVTTQRAETGNYLTFIEKSEHYGHISPKLGAGIKFFNELLRLRGGVGEGFKSPTADQLSADYVHSTAGVHYVGNPDLDPETSTSYDVGCDLLTNQLTLKIGWFRTEYADKIVQKSSMVNGVKTTSYDNHGDAEIDGLEVGLEWHMDQSLTLPFQSALWSNLTYHTKMEDTVTGKDLLYLSDYELKSGFDITYEKISAALSHILTGPQMISNYDTYMTEEKDSFNFWDMSLRYRISKQWEIKSSILNLFNQEVEWVRGYLMPERNYRLTLTYSF